MLACLHLSATGIDTTPLDDPQKVWKCDGCGWIYRNVPKPDDPPFVTRVAASPTDWHSGGRFVWRNEAELVWECNDDCPHPSHEEQP